MIYDLLELRNLLEEDLEKEPKVEFGPFMTPYTYDKATYKRLEKLNSTPEQVAKCKAMEEKINRWIKEEFRPEYAEKIEGGNL